MSERLTDEELSALTAAFPVNPALPILLAGAGIPASSLPGIYGLSSEEFWAIVADRIANGLAPDGRAKLLAFGARHFPASRVFTRPSMRVLVVSASPDERSPVRAGRESRLIQQALAGSDAVLDHLPAASLTDLAQLSGPRRPDILHLCCHGTPGFLEFEQPDGQGLRVPNHDLAELVAVLAETRKKPLTAIIVAACHSGTAVEALRPHAKTVIGHKAALDDDDAASFAGHLYTIHRLQREREGGRADLAAAAWAAARLVASDAHGRPWLLDGLIVDGADGADGLDRS